MGYKQGCLVELAPRSTWKNLSNSSQCKDKESVGSGSGILFSLSRGWVITHGSLLLSHISETAKQSELCHEDYFNEEHFQHLVALVTLDPRQELSSSRRTSHQTPLFRTARAAHTTKSEQFVGHIKCLWKAKHFNKVIQTFLPSSEGWNLLEDPDNGDEISESQLVRELLPFFILIHLVGYPEQENDLDICGENLIATGNTVHMVGTPFGSVSPAIFLNSVSEGIISNVVGGQQELIVTDARCIPGTEGGPLYLGSVKSRKCLIGVVVSALCWKNNEWIGLSLVCNISEVLHSLMERIYPEKADMTDPWKTRISFREETGSTYGTIQPSMLPVVLVKCPGSWGSGFIVDQEHGLVLTCSHVIKQQNKVQVRVDHPKSLWYNGNVIFATPSGCVFDIGVIQMHGYIPNKKWSNQIQTAESVHEGERCFVMGHPMFGQHHKLQASVTSGVISKVISLIGVYVLVQSTCTVNSGASGGPLVGEDGQVYGIVTCNAKDTATGASYPNVNLIIPLCTVWPVIKQYMISKDVSALKALHIRNKKLEVMWNMEGSQRGHTAVTSRL